VLFTIYKLLIISYIYIHIHRFIIFLAGLIQRSKTIEPAVQPVLNGWTSEPVNRQPRRFDLRSGPNNLGLKTSKSRWCRSQAKPESKRKFVKKKAAAVLRMGKVYVT